LLTIARTTRPSTDRLTERIHVPAVVVVGAFVLVLCTAVLPEMYAVGGTETPVWSNPEVTQHYITETYNQTGVENAVTSVLAAYRGFDTFGEAVVVFAAGVSTLLVLKREVFA
jgi:multicomponent Na+:H+ antiporter subunit B